MEFESPLLAIICFALGLMSSLRFGRLQSTKVLTDALPAVLPAISEDLAPGDEAHEGGVNGSQICQTARQRAAYIRAAWAIPGNQLRLAVEPNAISDEHVVRFLVANRGNVPKAAQQYRDYLAWRRQERIDAVRTEGPCAPEVEAALEAGFNPQLLDGLDARGRPVMVISIDGLDTPALRKLGVTIPILIRRHVKVMEALERRIDAAPDPFAGHLLILDIGGSTLGKFLGAWSLWREFARIGQQFYPECLGALCIVRGSGAAGWCVDKVKRVLHYETQQKMQLYFGEDATPALRDHLPPTTKLPPGSPLGAWPAVPTPSLAAPRRVGGLSLSSPSIGPADVSTDETSGQAPARNPVASPLRKGDPRRARALATLPELRAMLEAAVPPLTAGQWAFCTEGTLLRYISYHDRGGSNKASGDATPLAEAPAAADGKRPGEAKEVARAYSALQDTLKWRAAQGFDPDPISKQPRCCEQCDADPMAHCFFSIGHDQRGWEVIYCCPPRSRLKDPLSSSTHAFKCFEAIADRARDGPGTSKFVMCVDLHGLGFSDLNPATAMTTTSAILAHYVGQIGQICILDAPFAFKGLWSVLSGMLDATNAARVQMLRGEAMGAYFRAHFTDAQAAWCTEVLKMKAVPGNLPDSTPSLRMPLDTATEVETLAPQNQLQNQRSRYT